MRFTPLQINKDNERYYSSDYMQGFKDGVKRQCEADNSKLKRGEWKSDNANGKYIKETDWIFYCSVCGEQNAYAYDKRLKRFTDNFCPNCGADMRGGDK